VRPEQKTEDPQVPLHVAASAVTEQLGGMLDSAALALSNVSEIYYRNLNGHLLKIPQEELAVGGFEGGAKVFRTRSGNVYQSLSIRRADMADAITILKNAAR
jgi:molybdopterin/thiamine biosynthesis adenylyltransferase